VAIKDTAVHTLSSLLSGCFKGQVYSVDFADSVKELYKFSSCAGNCTYIYVWISVIGQWS